MTQPREQRNILGLVLAGGLSRRMGGMEKSLMQLHGKALIGHVVQRLSPQVASLVINANGDAARFANLALPVIPDTISGSQGPLAGILAGMEHARRRLPEVTHVLSVPADTPFFPQDLARRLFESADGKVALATNGSNINQAVGLWPVRLTPQLRAFLNNSGERRVMAFADLSGWTGVPFDDAGGNPFFNINTPQDLEFAQKLANR